MELAKHVKEHEALGFPEADKATVSIDLDIHDSTEKALPDDIDELPLVDSAASFTLKKFTWSNLKASVKTYFDTLYLSLAGGTLTGNVIFGNYKAIAMACDNGTTFPVSAVTGQWFYRTDIKTLFIYENSWMPLHSFGPVTYYVDGTNGSDAVGQGYSSGAGATKTIQYAIDLIPPINGGDIVINIADGTYTENISFQYKSFSGSFSLTVNGNFTTLLAATPITSATTTTITRVGAFGAINYSTKILKVSKAGNADKYAVIYGNTADVLTIATTFTGTVDSTWTFQILDQSVIVNAATSAAPTMSVANNQVLTANWIKLTNTTGNAVQISNYSTLNSNYCDFVNTNTSCVSIQTLSNFSTIGCYMENNGVQATISCQSGNCTLADNSWAKNLNNTVNGVVMTLNKASGGSTAQTRLTANVANTAKNINVTSSSGMTCRLGTYIENGLIGISVATSSVLSIVSAPTYVNCAINTSTIPVPIPFLVISSNTTLTDNHSNISVSGNTTITLPTAVGVNGKSYTIKKTDAGTTLTLATTSGQTIDGAAPGTLTVQWQSRTFVSNNVNWIITNSYL